MCSLPLMSFQCKTIKIAFIGHVHLTASKPFSSDGKASACNAGDLGSIPGSGRSPGEGNDNPLQYSCLENPVDGGAWGAIVHGVAKSRTRLSDFTHSVTHSCFPQFRQSICISSLQFCMEDWCLPPHVLVYSIIYISMDSWTVSAV